MKEFATAQIRNVALVAHHGVSKTTIAEAMLFNAKATTPPGRVADGTTLLDHAPDEIAARSRSTWASPSSKWSGHKINLLDTPGYPDFVGDVPALSAWPTRPCSVCAATGVEVGTGSRLGSLRRSARPARGREPDGQGARRLRCGGAQLSRPARHQRVAAQLPRSASPRTSTASST